MSVMRSPRGVDSITMGITESARWGTADVSICFGWELGCGDREKAPAERGVVRRLTCCCRHERALIVRAASCCCCRAESSIVVPEAARRPSARIIPADVMAGGVAVDVCTGSMRISCVGPRTRAISSAIDTDARIVHRPQLSPKPLLRARCLLRASLAPSPRRHTLLIFEHNTKQSTGPGRMRDCLSERVGCQHRRAMEDRSLLMDALRLPASTARY